MNLVTPACAVNNTSAPVDGTNPEMDQSHSGPRGMDTLEKVTPLYCNTTTYVNHIHVA